MRVLIFLFSVMLFYPTHGKTLIAVVGEYPPYVSRTEINANMAREIVEEAFDAVGYNLEFRWVPWKRAYEELKIGKADISFPLLKTEERASFLIYSDPIYSSKELFIYKREFDFKWQDINDLKNYRVGGSLGYEHVDTLISKGINVEIAQNDKSNLLKILSGRIDIFPVDPRVANFWMSDMDTTLRDATIMSEKVLSESDNYLVISKSLPESEYNKILDDFNIGLKQILTNGVYRKIIDKY